MVYENIFKRNILLNTNFGEKVVTHAVKERETFIKILKDGKIKLPSENKSAKKKTPYMEKVLGVDNCVYLSGGFTYNGGFQKWPYSFIFSKNILKERKIETYKAFLISQGWLRYLRMLKEKDFDYLDKIAQKSGKAKKEITRFKKEGHIVWWEIEKEISEILSEYPKKEEYLKDFHKFMKKVRLNNSYAPRYLSKDYLVDHFKKKIEIISRKSISFDDKNFLGIYVEKSKMKETTPLIERYIKKEIILYDGYKKVKL